MVQAMINIPERTNRVLNMVKAQFGLKTKSEAIAKLVEDFEESYLDKPLKESYIKKLDRIEKNPKFVKYDSLEGFDKAMKDA